MRNVGPQQGKKARNKKSKEANLAEWWEKLCQWSQIKWQTFSEKPCGLPQQSLVEAYGEGEIISRPQHPHLGYSLILQGRCEARYPRSSGYPSRTEYLGSGDFFVLEKEEVLQKPSPLIRAIEATWILHMSAKDLLSIERRRPRLSKHWKKGIHKRPVPDPSGKRSITAHFGRIVSVMALSESLPHDALFQGLVSQLEKEQSESILCVEFSSHIQDAKMKDWAHAIYQARSSFAFTSSIKKKEGILEASTLCLEVGETAEEIQALPSLLNHLGIHFRYIVMTLKSEIPVSFFNECLWESDLIYVLLAPLAEQLYELNLVTHCVEEECGADSKKIRPLFCFEDGWFQQKEERKTLKKWHWDGKVPILLRHKPPSLLPPILEVKEPLQQKQEEWKEPLRFLAREVKGCRLGLALSSGGAKGLAHIGVIQVLEENGIEIDVIAGASMGAYIAATWAHGLTGHEMEKLACEMEGKWNLLQLIDPLFPPRRGFIKGIRVKQRLQKIIGHRHFCEMARPLYVVGTRLDTFEREVFVSGEVATAVHASMAVPGVCVPVEIEGKPYIDGGIVDPVPVDVLRERGVEQIIAVNTLPTPEIVCSWMSQPDFNQASDYLLVKEKGWMGWFNQHLNYFASGNILDTMMRSIHAVQMRSAEALCQQADVVLQPLAPEARWIDFDQPKRYIDLGRKATEAHLDEIQALLAPRCRSIEEKIYEDSRMAHPSTTPLF